jgi:membrane fusion protein (multidrug efflux system)
MPPPFARSLRALDADRSRWWAMFSAFGIALAAAWLVWAFVARVSVYAQSASARLEVDRSASSVESGVAGRIVKNHLVLGAAVREGDVLIELDASSERLALAEARARLSGIAPRILAHRRELAAVEGAQTFAAEKALHASEEARARVAEAEAAARHAHEILARSERLEDAGLVSDVDVSVARAEEESRRLAVDTVRAAASRAVADQRSSPSERRVRVEQVAQDIATLEADEVATAAAIQRLEHEISLRTLRAPTSGRVAETLPVRSGSVVHEGQRLGAIVPDGKVVLRAEFQPADALGRVRPGQRGRLRLSGFPWAQYGAVDVSVTRVGSELRDGLLRVELGVDATRSRIPLEHGLPGTVEIEIEKVAPATLVLRSAGRLVDEAGQRHEAKQ